MTAIAPTPDVVQVDWSRALGPTGRPVVLAVSGGADSCALLDLLARDGRWPLTVWHLDHGLRSDSADDARFVAARGAGYGLTTVIERADIAALARSGKEGLEAAGRRFRYQRLGEVARQVSANTVCTAHHRDDQAETVLHHILRGAGDRGLAGMAERRPLAPGIDLVRPLLGWPRLALTDHLVARGLEWREDPTNRDQRLTRNHLRHSVLRDIELACPGFSEELAAYAQGRRLAFTASSASAKPLIDRWRSDQIVPVAELRATPAEARAAFWLAALEHLGLEPDRGRLRRLDDLINGPGGRSFRLGSWLFRRRYDTPAKAILVAVAT
ncbi:hypothetical protein LBMAG53_37660 [Planctomycetota bacterium]|nr:hypothetical protein LBMAG53_37660 [Planctomycetota bacterium]